MYECIKLFMPPKDKCDICGKASNAKYKVTFYDATYICCGDCAVNIVDVGKQSDMQKELMAEQCEQMG